MVTTDQIKDLLYAKAAAKIEDIRPIETDPIETDMPSDAESGAPSNEDH